MTVTVAPRKASTGGNEGRGRSAAPSEPKQGRAESESRHDDSKDPQKGKNLSHVPCRFFRIGACTAGDSCPFSHNAPEPGTGKQPCQWFVKGNCKFGKKCALAHILPGQPISMDKKNKKAAQLAAREAAALAAQAEEANSPPQPSLFASSGLTKVLEEKRSEVRAHPIITDIAHQTEDGFASPVTITSVTKSLFADKAPAPYAAVVAGTSPRPATDVKPRASNGNPVFSPSTPGTERRTSYNMSPVPRAENPYGPISPRLRPQDARTRDSDYSRSPPISRPNGTSIFGTSPFSNSGAGSVFLSYSHEEGDRFPHTAPAGELPRKVPGSGVTPIGNGRKAMRTLSQRIADEQGLDPDDDVNEEDFLPSSLTDLLTPVELQRRWNKANNLDPFVKSENLSKSVPSYGMFSSHASTASPLTFNNLATLEMPHTPPSHYETGLSPKAEEFFGRRPSVNMGSLTGATYAAPGFGISIPKPASPLVTHESHLNGVISPNTRYKATFNHAPGSSLPQGLAAGLSRLHLQASQHTGETPPPSNPSSLAQSPPAALSSSYFAPLTTSGPLRPPVSALGRRISSTSSATAHQGLVGSPLARTVSKSDGHGHGHGVQQHDLAEDDVPFEMDY